MSLPKIHTHTHHGFHVAFIWIFFNPLTKAQMDRCTLFFSWYEILHCRKKKYNFFTLFLIPKNKTY